MVGLTALTLVSPNVDGKEIIEHEAEKSLLASPVSSSDYRGDAHPYFRCGVCRQLGLVTLRPWTIRPGPSDRDHEGLPVS